MSLVNNQDAYVEYMIWEGGEGNIRIRDSVPGFRFLLRLPNFRGNYLSCVEGLEFRVDGEPVEPGDVQLLLNNKKFPLHVLPELFAEYWDCNECATVEILREGGLEGEHRIEVVMRLRYAYSAYFGVCKVVTSHCMKNLTF